MVETVSANTNFTFTVTNAPAAALFDANKTYVFIGAFYTGAAIPAATNAISLSGTVATVTTTNAHGLRVGDNIFVVGVSGRKIARSKFHDRDVGSLGVYQINVLVLSKMEHAVLVNSIVHPFIVKSAKPIKFLASTELGKV